MRMSFKPEVGLIFTVAHMENAFNVKYLKNGERCDVELRRSQREKSNMDYIDWLYEL